MQYNNLGKFIKEKRQKLGISLNKFSFLAEVDPAIICRIENLKQGIKIEILEKIAEVYHQSPAEFLTEFEHTSFGSSQEEVGISIKKTP